jgi:hypothetical protein
LSWAIDHHCAPNDPCKGKAEDEDDDWWRTEEQPISMGIIVNLTDRTVQGFGFPFDTKPLKMRPLPGTGRTWSIAAISAGLILAFFLAYMVREQFRR